MIWHVVTDTEEDYRVQAFVHVERSVYGAQFHSEQFGDSYSDGFTLPENFSTLARTRR